MALANPKMPEVGPKMHQDGPKMPQDSPNKPEGCSKMAPRAQDEDKMPQIFLKKALTKLLGTLKIVFPPRHRAILLKLSVAVLSLSFLGSYVLSKPKSTSRWP